MQVVRPDRSVGSKAICVTFAFAVLTKPLSCPSQRCINSGCSSVFKARIEGGWGRMYTDSDFLSRDPVIQLEEDHER